MEFVAVKCPQGARNSYFVSDETRPSIRLSSSNRGAQDEEVRRLYIERLGTGIRRMALAMEAYGLPRPHFEEVGSEFRVTRMGPGDRFMEEVETRPAWAGGLNERQVEALLYVGEHGRITHRKYQDLYGVSRETAKQDLRELVDKGLLTPMGHGRGLYYLLARL